MHSPDNHINEGEPRDMFTQAIEYVYAFLGRSHSWTEDRVVEEARQLVALAQERGLSHIPVLQDSRQSLQVLWDRHGRRDPLLHDETVALNERQKPTVTTLNVVVVSLLQRTAFDTSPVVYSVGSGATDVDLGQHPSPVVLIDPVYAEMKHGGQKKNVQRGHTHIAEPFHLSHINSDRLAVVIFEFSLHHVSQTEAEMRQLIERISALDNVRGIVVIDYHLQEVPFLHLLEYHQTYFASIMEQKELRDVGIAASLRVHTEHIFPAVEEGVGQGGFYLAEDPVFFPRLDSERDNLEGMGTDDIRYIQQCKCMKVYVR